MTARANTGLQSARRPIREALFWGPLSNPDKIALAGTHCEACDETSLGSVTLCPNCGSDRTKEIPLSSRGILWTYTVARHVPPGDYRGPKPFVPFGMGLVELPEGLRVLSTLDCPIDDLRVGLQLKFKPYVRYDGDGSEVVAFTYEPVGQEKSNG